MKWIFVLSLLGTGSLLLAQDFDEGQTWNDTLVARVDMFEGEKPLEMMLRFDMKKYQRTKQKGEYQDVELRLVVSDSFVVEKAVRVKARGNFRRSFCSVSPFWLNIRKAEVANVHLQEVKRMKIVTHCNSVGGQEANVMKEYLAYKMYERLTPLSFRVRLIRMTYIDTGRRNKETRTWAFAIEPEAMMAERVGGTVIKSDYLGMAHMRRDEMTRVALFQYLIGNGDYSITGRHNVKLLGMGEYGTHGFTPVPYDFDYTGLVDASYAIPGEQLGTKDIKERYYLGPCRSKEEYREAMDLLEEHREDFAELILGFPYLDEKARAKTANYVESYYEKASLSRFMDRELDPTCR